MFALLLLFQQGKAALNEQSKRAPGKAGLRGKGRAKFKKKA
jgi:hypothetical protein